ncbi:hypothetical protein BATDEDRAFT_85794 [Batrachochytrium dendrobatidis JAM81]|uniref:Essential protein Yae1 N-terminal domain-containing protein n=2 Tax=Batrachochytrium dendrobatidis TaxID=109871 RepID=F4NUD1_BATDJ|nr:uncharacterized protein BATDEDRAFT_85794 [Batrachochytrium dendrobatidis JAM81]EGF83179.1 hypothetical protein BATDEDRAFT_85794 [Batrachochytrium dendrobatidis JAM81]KAJ8325735.1 meiotic DNA integrity checkpoint [Batrachochytrium dendrobatidis]KAK5671625.1 meiotic DNA integrity checkpoint [Batrachochytrium dendrobatidis]OAJ36384.1 hypothetical protein BDEG_20564 [Batrachochytrium dendrobatidis JEL423]|eukprot:XP_006676007.1 hypothetical protein BATDEDRAFT_85794 [Batrachochytrium dendrobatidis JAM81]
MSAEEQPDLELLLHVESMFQSSGWDDGYKDGIDMGLLEGRIFGSRNGFQLGHEAGFYCGFAKLWKLVYAHQTTEDRTLPAKALKQLDHLSDAESKFPKENHPELDLQLEIQRLRGKYRTATSLLKVLKPGFHSDALPTGGNQGISF